MSESEASRRIPRPHHNYVPEYQMSGVPFVLTKTLPALILSDESGVAGTIVENVDSYKVSFDSVTRWFLLHNHDDEQKTDVRIYFNRTAAITAHNSVANQDPHYYRCDIEEVLPRLEIKCKEIYVIPTTIGKKPEISIVAGLTNVASSDFPDQQYTNGFTGVENNPNP